jgi:hypothetical protein
LVEQSALDFDITEEVMNGPEDVSVEQQGQPYNADTRRG